ncbi:MAG TPA: Wzz/FepE/Etk N-terminal domain-containing protein [Terriglobia bacterium]|nr:Wzz/FepE/Etk N-terminal domain-containing protein [Terriglobia bacterium]
MRDRRTETALSRERTYVPEELVIDAIDEVAVREARERIAARVRLLWSNRRFLFRATVVGLVLAAAIAFLIPKRYESTAQLMPPDQSMGSGTAMLAALSSRVGDDLAGVAQNALGMKTNGALFVGILKSNTVKDDLIRKFDLQKLYRARHIESARKKLASKTEISEDRQSGIITINVTDHDPGRASKMAQEYVDELNWVVTHLSTSSAHRERVFLDQRLDQVKADLEDAEKNFSQFASQKGAIDVPVQGRAMVVAAASLQGQLIAAESELQGLKQIYTDSNIRVRAVQARVNELRDSLRNIAGKGADESSSAGQLYPSLRELPLLGVTYADLLRRAKVQEAIFETLTKQDELAKVQEAKEVPSVKVLDQPQVPQTKSFPPRTLITALGAILAALAAIAWILAGSAWQATDSNDPRKAVAMEVWSSVRASLPWRSGNGSLPRVSAAWLRQKFRRKGKPSPGGDGPKDAEANRN